MRQLALRLEAAAADADWQALAAVDRELADALAAPGAGAGGSGDEHAFLRESHRQALACCRREAGRLDEHLSGLRANKEGWIAYAIGSDGVAT